MLATDRPRRDQPYVTRHARAVAAHIMAAINDTTTPAPVGPLPFMTRRAGGAFDRIMAACSRTSAPAEVVDACSTGVQPPPPRKPRRR